MNSETNNDKVTHQGVGSPAPACNVGANAGHNTSLSSDCRSRLVSVVDHLATDNHHNVSRGSTDHNVQLEVFSDFLKSVRDKEEAEIEKMKSVLTVMRAATLRQTNVSKDIKGGLEQFEESLDVIQH